MGCADPPVVLALVQIEARMRTSVKQNLFLAYKDARGLRRSEDYEKWVKKHHGQTLITSSQLVWTTWVEKALEDCVAKESPKPMQDLRKRYVASV